MSTYPPDLEAYVAAKFACGEFQSRDDFAVAAARLFRDMDERHAELKADIQAAIEQSDRGLSTPLDIDAVKARVVAKFRQDE